MSVLVDMRNPEGEQRELSNQLERIIHSCVDEVGMCDIEPRQWPVHDPSANYVVLVKIRVLKPAQLRPDMNLAKEIVEYLRRTGAVGSWRWGLVACHVMIEGSDDQFAEGDLIRTK
jgi:hypothetical protein